MHDISILHDLLKKQCRNLHAKRLSSLMIATQSLLDGYPRYKDDIKTPMIKWSIFRAELHRRYKDTH
ncbi:hypothetical protein, partial [Paraglaciecola chathamensis]|uniref:hypothetical protein n=1 Tax=Paraglaciecola chathamensis TaxID=368405 RepID=UPI0026F8DF47